MSLSYNGYRTGFPFPLITKNELGDPIGIWDQTTLYDYLPSGDSGQAVKVVGEGVPYYPLGFTLQQLCVFFWRAKTLKFAADFTSAQSPCEHTILVDGSAFVMPKHIRPQATPAISDYEVPSEAALISPIADNTTTAVVIDQEFPLDALFPFDGATPWLVGTWVETGGGYGAGDCAGKVYFDVDFSKTVLASDGKYYPYLSIRFEVWADNTLAGGGYPTACGINTAISDVTGPQLTLTICGAAGNISARQQYELAFPAESASGTITVSPEEYWTHGGIWNAASGDPT